MSGFHITVTLEWSMWQSLYNDEGIQPNMANTDIYVLTKTTPLDFVRHVSHNYYPKDHFDHQRQLYMSTEAHPCHLKLEVLNPRPPRLPSNYAELQDFLHNLMLALPDGTVRLMDDMMLSATEEHDKTSDLYWADGPRSKVCFTVQKIPACVSRDAYQDSHMHNFASPENHRIAYVDAGASTVKGEICDSDGKNVATISRGRVRLAVKDPVLELVVARFSDTGFADAALSGKKVLPFRLAKRKIR